MEQPLEVLINTHGSIDDQVFVINTDRIRIESTCIPGYSLLVPGEKIEKKTFKDIECLNRYERGNIVPDIIFSFRGDEITDIRINDVPVLKGSDISGDRVPKHSQGKDIKKLFREDQCRFSDLINYFLNNYNGRKLVFKTVSCMNYIGKDPVYIDCLLPKLNKDEYNPENIEARPYIELYYGNNEKIKARLISEKGIDNLYLIPQEFKNVEKVYIKGNNEGQVEFDVVTKDIYLLNDPIPSIHKYTQYYFSDSDLGYNDCDKEYSNIPCKLRNQKVVYVPKKYKQKILPKFISEKFKNLKVCNYVNNFPKLTQENLEDEKFKEGIINMSSAKACRLLIEHDKKINEDVYRKLYVKHYDDWGLSALPPPRPPPIPKRPEQKPEQKPPPVPQRPKQKFSKKPKRRRKSVRPRRNTRGSRKKFKTPKQILRYF